MSSRDRRRGAVGAAWHVLIGRPLRADESSSTEISSVEGLPALSLDALTSVAYGPEAIIVVLALAGAGALHLVLEVTIAIVVLLVILITSYRQVIDAYPGGGGAYAVSRANLFRGASELAAASLIVDYTLTVAVSIAAGVGAFTSAFPSLSSLTVPLCLGILAVITILNLRGLGESARAFLLPTGLFIVGLLVVIAVGLVHPLAQNVPAPGRILTPTHGLEVVGVLLVLKAFAAGCTALTGVEAIANGVPLFKPPRQRTAKRTEMLLGVLLGVMLLGLAVLAVRFKIQPRSGQTVLSQIMGAAVGRHWAYFIVSLTITLVLALAANTSFGGLPVLASLLARDNRLPHMFALRGDRLVFANGIWALSLMSAALLIAVRGNTDALIPMFAIGVFTGFTLSQTGLVIHWRRTRPHRWRQRAAINALGAVVTGASTVIFLVTKFLAGAWVVVVAVPLFILLFQRISSYYKRVAAELGLGTIPPRPRGRRTTVVVPVSNVSRLTSRALAEALSIGQEVIAVSVVFATDATRAAAAGGGDGHGAGSRGRAVAAEHAGAGDGVASAADLYAPDLDAAADGATPADRDAGDRDAADRDAATASDAGMTAGEPAPVPVIGDSKLQAEWAQWHPGVPLVVLRTEYASVSRPIVDFVDELRAERDDQIVVLIPVTVPARFRHRALHNQLDLVLSTALRGRDDIVVARVPMMVDAFAGTGTECEVLE